MRNSKNKKIREITLVLLGIYILSLSLLKVWILPIFGSKIQPPEIIFLLIISWLTLNVRHLPRPTFRMNTMTIPLLGYVLAVILSAIFSPFSGAFTELIGLFYLLCLLQVIVYVLVNFCDDIPAFVVKWFTYLGVFAAILAITGWTMYQLGTWTPLVRFGTTYYPYFGYVGRVQGATMTPGMYMTIISISIVLLAAKMLFDKVGKWDFLALIIMLIAAFLTLSKSLILLLVGLIFLFQRRFLTVGRSGIKALTSFQKTAKIVLKITSIFLVIFVFFATHFIVIQKEGGGVPAEMSPYIQVGKPLFESENTALYLCIYGHLKEAAIEIGCQNNLFGIGTGQFLQAIPEMKAAGVYPQHFEDADPHSTYFGAWAEIGWLGLFLVLSLWMQIWRKLYFLKEQHFVKYQSILIGISACFLVVLFEAVYTDVLNFRHYWVLFAVFYAIYEKKVTT
jgi:hypothetical protein